MHARLVGLQPINQEVAQMCKQDFGGHEGLCSDCLLFCSCETSILESSEREDTHWSHGTALLLAL